MTNDEKEQSVVPLATPKPWPGPGCPACPSVVPRLRDEGGFTLLELLIVVGIIGLLLVLIAPAFTTIKGGTDVTSAAYTIQAALDTARTYAKANNTYVWVGFYEENVDNPGSPNASPPPVGRLLMSIVASKDGTNVAITNPIDPTKLIQVEQITKIKNVHLWNAFRTIHRGPGQHLTPARP